MTRPKNSVWWTVQCSTEERDAVDEAAEQASMNRNAFVRAWIASLMGKK